MGLRAQFISRKVFGRADRKTEPAKPFTGPFFERPAGSRDPKAEERIRLYQGYLNSLGC